MPAVETGHDLPLPAGFKSEARLVTLCHSEGRSFFGANCCVETQLCHEGRPFANSGEICGLGGERVDLLSLEDLVDAKKTQRDKDWPMITRLIERSYFTRNDQSPQALVEFWFRELRTPELLIELATAYPEIARQLESVRPAITCAVEGEIEKVARAIEDEEREERRKDREYWRPLKLELEQLRRERLNQKL